MLYEKLQLLQGTLQKVHDSATRLPLNVGIMNSRKSLEKNKFCQKDFVAAPHVCFS